VDSISYPDRVKKGDQRGKGGKDDIFSIKDLAEGGGETNISCRKGGKGKREGRYRASLNKRRKKEGKREEVEDFYEVIEEGKRGGRGDLEKE